MTPNPILGMLADLQKPGFWKAILGQAAIAIGHQIVAGAAEEAEERLRTATDQVDLIDTAMIEKGQALADLVMSGALDAAVTARAGDLGWRPPAPESHVCGTCDAEFGNLADLVDHHDEHIAARSTSAMTTCERGKGLVSIADHDPDTCSPFYPAPVSVTDGPADAD